MKKVWKTVIEKSMKNVHMSLSTATREELNETCKSSSIICAE